MDVPKLPLSLLTMFLSQTPGGLACPRYTWPPRARSVPLCPQPRRLLGPPLGLQVHTLAVWPTLGGWTWGRGSSGPGNKLRPAGHRTTGSWVSRCGLQGRCQPQGALSQLHRLSGPCRESWPEDRQGWALWRVGLHKAQDTWPPGSAMPPGGTMGPKVSPEAGLSVSQPYSWSCTRHV